MPTFDPQNQITHILIFDFRENLVHNNVSFNENGTLSYVATRTAVFVPEMNTIDLNQTLFLPNLAVLVRFAGFILCGVVICFFLGAGHGVVPLGRPVFYQIWF